MTQQGPPDLHEIRRLQEKYPDLDLSWMLIDYIEFLEAQRAPLDSLDRLYISVICGVPVGLFILIMVVTIFNLDR